MSFSLLVTILSSFNEKLRVCVFAFIPLGNKLLAYVCCPEHQKDILCQSKCPDRELNFSICLVRDPRREIIQLSIILLQNTRELF